MAKVFVTRKIPEAGIEVLKNAGHEVVVSEKDGVLSREELLQQLSEHNPEAVLCLLTDKIDSKVFEVAQGAKIFANYAVGFDNINLDDAKNRGVVVTNTPGVLTDTVAEHAMALIVSIMLRIPEADRYARAGKYKGWAPMMYLGSDLKGKTLAVLGAGRIGQRVAHIAKNGFDMKIIYYDVARNEDFEREHEAEFMPEVDEALRQADVVSVHVPLLDSTVHLINAERLALMKPTAYLVNTSRGPVVDEVALVSALREGVIKGAALDVYENEPAFAEGLADLDNIVVTPHIASASIETRDKMAEMAAQNIVEFLNGNQPPNAL